MFEQLLCGIVNEIVNPLLGILIAIAFAVFIWGVAQFLLRGEDAEARSQGRKHMIYGIIGMFIMFAVLGIIAIMTNTFGITDYGVSC